MDKNKFNNLSIEDQINYINENLNNSSLTKICKELGVNRPTISKRFNSKGYKFIDNQYILNNTNTTINTINSKDKNNIDKVNVLENKIKSLESRLNELERYIKNTNNTETTKEVKIFEGDEVVRSFRINEDIQKRFKIFCKAHSEYRVSDLINNALDCYMDGFNKK